MSLNHPGRKARKASLWHGWFVEEWPPLTRLSLIMGCLKMSPGKPYKTTFSPTGMGRVMGVHDDPTQNGGNPENRA